MGYTHTLIHTSIFSVKDIQVENCLILINKNIKYLWKCIHISRRMQWRHKGDNFENFLPGQKEGTHGLTLKIYV